jgi:hypothetical protein
VHRGAVSGAVIGQELLDLHAVALEERDRSAEEPDCCCGLLVAENLGVGQARGVVDRDVHELPADLTPSSPGSIGLVRVAAFVPMDAVPSAALNTSKLLDVDMDQLPASVRS